MKSLHSDEGGSLECTSRACNIRLKRRGVHVFGLKQAVLVVVIWPCLGYNKLRHAGAWRGRMYIWDYARGEGFGGGQWRYTKVFVACVFTNKSTDAQRSYVIPSICPDLFTHHAPSHTSKIENIFPHFSCPFPQLNFAPWVSSSRKMVVGSPFFVDFGWQSHVLYMSPIHVLTVHWCSVSLEKEEVIHS